MAYDLGVESTDWEAMFSTALNIGADQVANPPNTVDTVPTNAVQSMQPVSQQGVQNWAGFWQDRTKGVLGYVAPVVRQQGTAAVVTQPRPAQAQGGSLLLLVIVGAIGYAAAKG